MVSICQCITLLHVLHVELYTLTEILQSHYTHFTLKSLQCMPQWFPFDFCPSFAWSWNKPNRHSDPWIIYLFGFQGVEERLLSLLEHITRSGFSGGFPFMFSVSWNISLMLIPSRANCQYHQMDKGNANNIWLFYHWWKVANGNTINIWYKLFPLSSTQFTTRDFRLNLKLQVKHQFWTHSIVHGRSMYLNLRSIRQLINPPHSFSMVLSTMTTFKATHFQNKVCFLGISIFLSTYGQPNKQCS